MIDKEEVKTKKMIKRLLAERLGVEPDDIKDDDSFKEELHMNPIILTDFVQKLTENGYETESLDFSEIDNLIDLYEVLL